jgi:hypothetical protein
LCECDFKLTRMEEILQPNKLKTGAYVTRDDTNMIPVLDEARCNTLFLSCHILVHSPRYEDPYEPLHSQYSAPIAIQSIDRPGKNPIPKANGATPETILFMGDNAPTTLISFKNRSQSSSFTS